MRKSATIHFRYLYLLEMLTNRYRTRLCNADPRLEWWGAFHLAHNWGNDAAQCVLARFNVVYSAVVERGNREYLRAFDREERR